MKVILFCYLDIILKYQKCPGRGLHAITNLDHKVAGLSKVLLFCQDTISYELHRTTIGVNAMSLCHMHWTTV